MTLQEFKAWFEGFTEDMSAAPSKKQWERIKKRVKEIDGSAVTYPVFVDRYWPHVYPSWPSVGTTGHISSGTAQLQLRDGGLFNSMEAMGSLGKADYLLCP
jgi:hypothetical protein